MKRLGLFLLAVVMVAGMAGCPGGGGDDSYVWTIRNQSSYRVDVQPNGQTWIGFVMNPGDVRYIETDEEDLYWSYAPAGRVYSKQTGPMEISFFNR